MKILFTTEAYKKLRAYIQGIDYEISGFGKIEKTADCLKIIDVKIFQQVVSAGHTEMDAVSLANFWNELDNAGEDIGKWKLWWHSHVDMQAFFSGTDTDTIEEFDSEMPNDNWMLSIVGNHMGKLFARVDIFSPIRCTITDLPYDVDITDQQVEVDVAQEIKDKVVVRNFSNRNANDTGNNMISWWSKSRKVITPEERIELGRLFPHLSHLSLGAGGLDFDGEPNIQDGVIFDENGNPTA